jgi:hypothetical protein
MSDNLQRDNWTNEQVMEFLKGLKLVEHGNNDRPAEIWNAALEQAICQFYDFARKPSEWGCMAYDKELKAIVSIGNGIPYLEGETEEQYWKRLEEMPCTESD